MSLGLQQQLVVLVVPLPLDLHLSPLGPSIIINDSYTNDQSCLYDVLDLFKSVSGHGTFKCFMVLALGYVLITTSNTCNLCWKCCQESQGGKYRKIRRNNPLFQVRQILIKKKILGIGRFIVLNDKQEF